MYLLFWSKDFLKRFLFGSSGPCGLSPRGVQAPCSSCNHVVTIARRETLPHAHKDVHHPSRGPGFPNNIKNAVPACFPP